MVNRIEIIPLEVRGYGNIVTPKTSNDFIGKYNEIYTNIDGDFVLSYGGVMLKITSNVSNTIKGLTAGLNVIVTTRDGGVPVSGLTVDCSIDEVSLTSETTDSNGECSFNWTPQIVGDSVILLTITAQDDYAGLTETKEITIGLLLSFNSIMNDLRLEDDELYIADISEQVESRTQLNPFVKDVWVAEGGEPIVDEYGIIHLAKKGDVIVEQDSLDQSLEYDNVIFEGDVELLTGAVYDMSLTEDYELIVNCLERDDIIGASGLISLTASQTSVTYGSSVTLTATVIDGDTPVSGGTVTFYDGETSLGTDTTDSDGVATLSTSSLSVGSHSLSAVYDDISSNHVSVTVNKLTPTISLSVPASGTVGTAYTVTGTLVPSSGSVKLYENGSLKDTLIVSGGSFSKAITQSNEGTYSYYVVFEGSSTYDSITSSTSSIVVSDAPAPTPASVSLTSDKSILSYADSESATLSATVLDNGSNPIEGVTVEFFKGSTSLGTADTNSSGVATKSYASSGVGDVSFTAEVGSLVSETYGLEDCWLYDNVSTDKSSNYTKTSSLSVTYDTDHYILSNSAQNQFLNIAEDYDNVAFEVEAKLIQPATAGNNGFGLMDATNSLKNTAFLTIELSRTQFLTFTNGTYGTSGSQNITKDNSKYYTYIVTVNGNSVNGKVYDSGTQLYSANVTKSLTKKYYNIGLTSNNTIMHIKKIKVKAL